MSRAKKNAAAAALEYVHSDMVLGLGSGSTAEIFLERLGQRVAGGLRVVGVPTSQRTAEVAREAGITLITPDKVSRIDLTVDGADEVGPKFHLIKGGGACLLREKIIAQASDRFVCIVDPSKMVKTLGTFALPVEVDPFAVSLTADAVHTALVETGIADVRTVLRQKGDAPLVTDGGHYILDCDCGTIPDPVQTANALAAIAGVMEHGLFVDIADVIVVGEDDQARVMEITR